MVRHRDHWPNCMYLVRKATTAAGLMSLLEQDLLCINRKSRSETRALDVFYSNNRRSERYSSYLL